MDKPNENIDVSEQEIPFRLLPPEEKQRIIDANQRRVREATTIYEWDIRVKTPYAWLIIIIPLGALISIGIWSVLGGEMISLGWGLIVMGGGLSPYFRYLVMADKNYNYRLTTEGVVVTYHDAIPEIAYTIVRGLAWLGVVVCLIAVAVLGPFALVGAGGMALLAVFFTDFKSEVTEHETMFKKDWAYTLFISNKKKAVRFESNPFKISYSDNLYCKSQDFERIVELIKNQIECVEIKYIKGHPMT
ncbi:hypothetical protein [Aeromonas media]|uniref:hypothetical protein n=1 Tax=Aeromonas media TaxID=651 RepID=UPI00223FBD3C|nr:hypothetical protein [Aeromonas media]